MKTLIQIDVIEEMESYIKETDSMELVGEIMGLISLLKMHQARVKELKVLVEKAYKEGMEDGYDTECLTVLYDQPNNTLAICQAWMESDAKQVIDRGGE